MKEVPKICSKPIEIYYYEYLSINIQEVCNSLCIVIVWRRYTHKTRLAGGFEVESAKMSPYDADVEIESGYDMVDGKHSKVTMGLYFKPNFK